MPLEHAAVGTPGFSRNVATEVNAGKPQKQAVAIAYSKARGDAKPVSKGPKNSQYVETNKGSIPVGQYSFGWAVRAGKYEGIGSFNRKEALVEAINKADSSSKLDSIQSLADELFCKADAVACGIKTEAPQGEAIVGRKADASPGDKRLHDKMDRLLETLKHGSLSANQFGNLLDLARLLKRTGDLPARKDSAVADRARPSAEVLKEMKAAERDLARLRETGDTPMAQKLALRKINALEDEYMEAVHVERRGARVDAGVDRKTWDQAYTKLLQKRNAVEREIPLTINADPDKQQKLKSRLSKIKAEIEEHQKSKPETKVQFAFGSRKDAAGGYTEIWTEDGLDQTVDHNGNYKAIIAREVADLKKAGMARVRTKVFDAKADAAQLITSRVTNFNNLGGYTTKALETTRQQLMKESAEAKKAGDMDKRYDLLAKAGKIEEHLGTRSDAAGEWIVLNNGATSGRAGTRHKSEAEAKARAAELRRILKSEGRPNGDVTVARADADYNEEAVNKAIAAQNRSGRGKIGGREGKMIHALLKGNEGYASRNAKKDAKYTGKPREPHQFRYELALCGKDEYGVYDNKQKRFVEKGMTKSEAQTITNKYTGRELDQMLIGLARKSGLLKDSEPKSQGTTLDSLISDAEQLFGRADAVQTGKW